MTVVHRCDEKALLLYWHGELSPVRRLLVERHLRSCDACRCRCDALARTSAAFSEAIMVEGPSTFGGIARSASLLGQPVRFTWKTAVALMVLVASLALAYRFFASDAGKPPHPKGGAPISPRCSTDLPPVRNC